MTNVINLLSIFYFNGRYVHQLLYGIKKKIQKSKYDDRILSRRYIINILIYATYCRVNSDLFEIYYTSNLIIIIAILNKLKCDITIIYIFFKSVDVVIKLYFSKSFTCSRTRYFISKNS